MPLDDTLMESFSPEFAQYWLTGQCSAAAEPASSRRSEESPSAPQQEALEALAERVNAARSVL